MNNCGGFKGKKNFQLGDFGPLPEAGRGVTTLGFVPPAPERGREGVPFLQKNGNLSLVVWCSLYQF